jgi:plasmid stability protein
MNNMNASHLTIRNMPQDVAAALENEKRRRGTSLNQTVIEILRQSLGVRGNRTNGLARLAGTWSEADEREFLNAVEPFNEIDRELWK